MVTSSRYDGKPLLKLLEFYVLKVIGQLPQVDENKLNALAPKLQAIYGGGEAWYDAIAAAVHLPPEIPEVIREIWAKNQEIAHANGNELRPQQFAEKFVDENWGS